MGLFSGYDPIVWLVIVFQTTTGLLIAYVMKYADSILKGFCTSIAVVVGTLFSIWLFDTRVDSWFIVGAFLVLFATHLYQKYPSIVKKLISNDAVGPISDTIINI